MNGLLHSVVTYMREVCYSFKLFPLSHFSWTGTVFCPKHSHRNGLLVRNWKILKLYNTHALHASICSCKQREVKPNFRRSAPAIAKYSLGNSARNGYFGLQVAHSAQFCRAVFNTAATRVMEAGIVSVLKHRAMKSCMGFEVKSS
jgi:hypothetical protein